MVVKLLTEHHLEFLSLKVGRRGSSESTLVKMSNCWKSHALALKFIKNAEMVVSRNKIPLIVCRWDRKICHIYIYMYPNGLCVCVTSHQQLMSHGERVMA